MKDIEEQAVLDIAKYFDRINDKLFSLNNIAIATYVGLIVFTHSFNHWLVTFPFVNFYLLLAVDYYMMEYNRTLSRATDNSPKENASLKSFSCKSTLISLATIISTSGVILILLYEVVSKKLIIP